MAVIEAALDEFSRHGFDGASTDVIARRAGISQPYVFRLFGTKHELIKAAVHCCLAETLKTFQDAGAGKHGASALDAIAASYVELLRRRPRLFGRLQADRALDDPEIREIVRTGYGAIALYVERASGASPNVVADFLGRGLLIDLIASLELDVRREPWSQRLFASLDVMRTRPTASERPDCPARSRRSTARRSSPSKVAMRESPEV